MALIGKIAIAMGVDTKGLKKGFASASVAVKSFDDTVATSSRMLGIFATVAAGVATAAVIKLVHAGSDLIENQNKVNAVFGDSADIVLGFADKMATAFGSSKREIQDAAGVFGGLFKNLGYSAGDAAQLSVQMVKLAADLASFKNLSFDEALLKIRAGLTGESEPLKAIGILINETAVKTEAYAMKLAKVGSELNEQQKVQARLSLLVKQTADAQGDLAKTADDVANATRGVYGRIENLAALIGETLQPVAKAVLGGLAEAIQAASLAWLSYSSAVVTGADTTVGAIATETDSVGFLQKAIGKVADAWQYVELGLLGLSANVTPVIIGMIDVVGFLARAIDKLAEVTGFGATGVGQFFTDMAAGLEQAAKATDDLFKSKLAEFFEGGPKASEGVNRFFEEARAKIAATRAELAKSAINPNAFKPVASAIAPAINKAAAHNTAQEFGSQEAANTILRSRYGGGMTNKENAKIAANTSDAAKSLRELVKRATTPEAGGALIVASF